MYTDVYYIIYYNKKRTNLEIGQINLISILWKTIQSFILKNI